MNPSNDYSQFGFRPIAKETQEKPSSTPINDYSEFGFRPVETSSMAAEEKPKQEKVGKFKSALYGAAEGVLGLPALLKAGHNKLGQTLDSVFGIEMPKEIYDNHISNLISTFPESEDEASRRIRTGTSGAIAGLPFGLPGVIAGVTGSQAGQTVREKFGKEGKFDSFGLGEGAAIAADFLGGGAAGAATSLGRNGINVSRQVSQVPSIFRNSETGLQRTVTKNAIQGEKNALQSTIEGFGREQIQGFDQAISQVSPRRYTDFSNSNASALKQHAETMFRNAYLDTVSPLNLTLEQGGRTLQEAANTVFQNEVLTAERQAYTAAKEAANGITGSAPRTIEQATALRDNLVRNNPTPEQQPVISFLNGLIEDLQTVTPASRSSASSLVDASGRPLIEAVENAASTNPTVRSANDLVDVIQRANQAVNYGAEGRLQSHRLAPIIATLRQEVGQVLNKNPTAARLYQEANSLHGTNAETWGTRFMRSVRFSENPELIIGKTKHASNMRNFKTAISDPEMQGLAERLVLDQISSTGSSTANRQAITRLNPELSTNARNASTQLISGKDPLTTVGGRVAVSNEILKDAAQAVSSGKRPEKILDLMQTPKGYQIVRETMNGAPQSRELFRSVERLFVEDIFNSVLDRSGKIDFAKAKRIFKNNDIRNVVNEIGGDNLVRRFNELETFANNFERNIDLYKTPAAQSVFKNVVKNVKGAGLVAGVLHALHIPLPIIAGLGLAKVGYEATKVGYKALQSKILSNPRAVRILEQISLSRTAEDLSKQLPRLIAEIEKKEKK